VFHRTNCILDIQHDEVPRARSSGKAGGCHVLVLFNTEHSTCPSGHTHYHLRVFIGSADESKKSGLPQYVGPRKIDDRIHPNWVPVKEGRKGRAQQHTWPLHGMKKDTTQDKAYIDRSLRIMYYFSEK
jgi:hypothetical protein